jgi:4-hydroxy-tetrahydrodipicolinate synthase
MAFFEGAISALPTPFQNGSIDRKSLSNLVRYQLERGIEGFVVNGTTAESPCLSWSEVEEIFATVKSETKGNVPLLIGTGSNSTQETLEKSLKAEKMGADGLLIVTPYYNKPPQRGLIAHYRTVAESVKTPILLYNVPGRTAVSLTPETIAELSEVPNIVGCKEATGDLVFGKSVLSLVSDEFNMTSGDDLTFLDLAAMGGKGVISVLSNVIPKETASLLKRARNKDMTAIEEFKKYHEFTKQLFVEANPIPVKAALAAMGIISSDEMRLPLVPMHPEHKEKMKTQMKELGLL